MDLSKARFIGFITILIILLFLGFLTFKILQSNQAKQQEEKLYIAYKKPAIEMSVNGNYLEYILVGSSYLENGIYLKKQSLNDNLLITYLKDGEEVASIDTNEIGTYLVKYTVVDKNKKNTIYKTVIVYDNQKPIISFDETTVIKSADVETFDLKQGVIVSDNSEDVNISYKGNITKTPGEYIITYTAIDLSGNKTVKKRLIKVV